MTTKKLTHSAQEILVKLAKNEAKAYHALYVEPDHVALALLRKASPTITEIFHQTNVSLKRVIPIFESLIESKVYTAAPRPHQIRYDSQIHQMLQQASAEAESFQQPNIHEEHLLLAILADDESALHQCLSKFGLGYQEIHHQLKHAQKAATQAPLKPNGLPQQIENLSYCINLNHRVSQAKNSAQSLTARDSELNQIMRILKRHTKNNPLLLGPAGVGKTAIIEALADKINRNNVPAFLRNTQIYELNIAALLAGTRYRGDFEERINQVVQLFEANTHFILFIDEIHLIAGAGSSQESPLDMANILKPALARGRLRCIGATTYQEYQQYIQSDAALERRFQQVHIDEPNDEQMLDILRKVAHIYQEAHQVHYPQAALQQIIALSNIYFPNRFMPDKAIDLMDEIGATKNLLLYNLEDKLIKTYQQLMLEQHQAEGDNTKIQQLCAEYDELKSIISTNKDRLNQSNITLNDIFMALSNKLKISTAFLNEPSHLVQAKLLAKIHQQIVGNHEVISMIVKQYVRAFRGTMFRAKPLLSLLLLGPQLIGKKTLFQELTLASHPNQNIFYYLNMAQYSSMKEVEELFLEPNNSYQNQPHNLIHAIKEQPQLMIYLDNIGMAHESFFPKLKTLLTKGTVISSSGRQYQLYNCMIVMASSLNQHLNRSGFGFDPHPSAHQSIVAIDRFLAHALQGNLSNLVDYSFSFAPLTQNDLNKLFNLQFDQLKSQLQPYTQAKLQATSQLEQALVEQALLQPDQLVKLFSQKVERPLWHFLLDNHQNSHHRRLLIDYVKTADSISITAKENAS